MSNTSLFHYALPKNEPILSYAHNSVERKELNKVLTTFLSQKVDIPLIINNKPVKTNKTLPLLQPHDIKHELGKYHLAGETDITNAITSCLQAKTKWEAMSFENRANVFLKAADLIAGKYRAQMNAATMLGQSKNVYQSEIDAICELADFFRFNVYFLSQIYQQQPISSDGILNRMEYRPLEGFVYAVTPFNFTAIGANLVCAPALCGNVVIWKPSPSQMLSAYWTMQILIEAGLPEGVINLIVGNDIIISKICLQQKEFSGLHFTGSTLVFNQLWKQIADNVLFYKNYPRIVGETGGKDFVLVHASAQVKQVATALIRGAFEYQGQKCSAVSRAYIPASMANALKTLLVQECKKIKMGHINNFGNFVNAVINEKAFMRIEKYITIAKKNSEAKIIFGGNCNQSKGYFIQPTIIETTNPKFITMQEEIFGPVLTLYVYDDKAFDDTLKLVNETSQYALTGAVFATDRIIIDKASEALAHAAGNFYINDKPSGAVVGQQPFGGARKSGTNDKAGSMLNLYRWLSARTIKETFQPPTDFAYPYMNSKKR